MPGISVTIGGKMDAASVKAAFGQVESAAEQSAIRISESQANAYGDWWRRKAAEGVDAKRIKAAEELVQSRAKTMLSAMGGGWAGDKESIKAERDALARAIRARRALRDLGDAAGGNGGLLNALKGSTSASSQLISVFSNTLSSLGSGMNPFKVFMQQGPNLAQAFTLMGRSALQALKAVLPFAAVAAVFAGIGYAVYRVHRYFKDLADGIKYAANPGGRARADFAQLNDELRNGADYAANFRKWMMSLGGETLSTAQKTDLLLKKLREKARLEAEIAKGRGATPQQLLEMETEQLKTELEIVNKAIEKSYEKRAEHLGAAKQAEKGLEGNIQKRADAAIADADNKRFAAAAKAIADKLGITELMQRPGSDEITKTQMVSKLNRMGGYDIVPESYTTTVAEEIDRLKKQEVVVEVDGIKQKKMNFLEAEREAKASLQRKSELDRVEADLVKILDSKKKLTKSDIESIKSLHDERREIENALQLKNEYGSTIAGLGGGGRQQQPLTSREQIGAYAGGGLAVTILDVNRQQLATMKSMAKDVAKFANATPTDGVSFQ